MTAPPQPITTLARSSLDQFHALFNDFHALARIYQHYDTRFAANKATYAEMKAAYDKLCHEAASVLGWVSSTELPKFQVLLGLGRTRTVPAVFWSTPSLFEAAARELATQAVSGSPTSGTSTSSDSALREARRRIIAETNELRISMQSQGAFVGHLPLERKQLKRKSWTPPYVDIDLPPEIAFYYPEWSVFPLFSRLNDAETFVPPPPVSKWDYVGTRLERLRARAGSPTLLDNGEDQGRTASERTPVDTGDMPNATPDAATRLAHNLSGLSLVLPNSLLNTTSQVTVTPQSARGSQRRNQFRGRSGQRAC